MSLLELVIASSMMAMVMATVMVVLRTGRQAWDAHEGDYVRIEAAHATLRHIVRQIRQADAVDGLTRATDGSGSPADKLTLLMPVTLLKPLGEKQVWQRDGSTNQVNYGTDVVTPTALLAPEITGLRFTGFLADGVQETANPSEMQCLRVDVSVTLPAREIGGARTVSSWGWIRSW